MEKETLEKEEFATPLFELRAYGHANKAFFMGMDVSGIATKVDLKLGGDSDGSLSIEFDLRALGKEAYKDKANSGLKIR